MLTRKILSELISVPSTPASRRAFRRNAGFVRLRHALAFGLTWRAQKEGEDEQAYQVDDVQRSEGQRLALETLSWATGDRENQAFFEVGPLSSPMLTRQEHGGYSALLKTLWELSPPVDAQAGGTSARHTPDVRILGLLLAHILNNNYSLLSIFGSPESIDSVLKSEDALTSKLGDVTISKPAALPLLWAYLWGLSDAEPVSPKGKERDTGEEDVLFAGGFGGPPGSLKAKLVLLVIDIFRLAAISAAGVFQLKNYLPTLADFLLTRLYGWAPERQFAVTFHAREEWFQNANAEDAPPKPTWTPAEEPLRSAYLALLKRLLEAGTSPEQTWRLFQLVRKVPPKAKPLTPIQEANEDSGAGTPNALSPPPSASSAKSFRGKATLKVVVPAPPLEETLDLEVLEIIHKAMHARTPDVFVFRGGHAIADGGIELSDIGRSWPSSTKGFIFTSWIYITRLNDAITVLHVSQRGEQHPLFRVRILENSQVGLTSTTQVDGSSDAPEEVVCQGPEALIPHHEWVHFAVGCRKGRSANGGGGEARIFVNGKRVGAVRIPYPVPSTKPRPHRAQRHGPNYERHAHHRSHSQQGVRVSIGRPWMGKDSASLGESFLLGGGGLGKEDNQWMLGRALLLEDVITEDLVLLMHHLGPRYYGNYQEALGKFLTYKGATSVNLYLHSLAQAASQQKTIPLLPTNSALVRSIRTGPSIAEENIMLSLCSKDALVGEDGAPGEFVLNGAVTHAFHARDVRYGRAKMVDHVFPFATTSMDEAVSTVGGGVVVLKLIDLAQDSEQLATTLTVLHDMIRDSWSASEEMERIHGFELLAAILRPKMATIVDMPCAKILLGILGVNPDKPQAAVVHNSAAYRAIGLDFELWATAKDDVVALYFENFQALLAQSKYKRYNLLRTFQKSNMVRKLLFAIRLGLYNTTTIPLAVDTLKLALTSRWSAEEGIKPVFSYLVSALCQNAAQPYLVPASEPTAAQLPAALILQMMSELLEVPKRLAKLAKAVSLHRLLVVFLQSNPAPFVAIPCLDIIKLCLSTPGLDSFQRSFESEGGFALLARTLPPIWQDHIQETVFAIVLGKDGTQGSALACPPAIASLTTALEYLLQSANEAVDGVRGSSPSKTVRSPAVTPITLSNEATDTLDISDDDRLEKLLYHLAAVYRNSKPFRKGLSVRRIESMLPSFVDFAAMSASPERSERAENQRVAAASWLSELIASSKAPANVITQMKLLVEQLKSTSGEELPPTSSSTRTPVPTPPLSRNPSFRSSGTSRLASSPTGLASPPIRRKLHSDTAIQRPAAVRRASSSTADKKMPALRRVLTGESILQEGQDKNSAWRMIILSTDAQRFATMTLDRKEHWHRLSQVEWPQLVATLRSENGVWADEEDNVQWRLDGSEGPLRMRSRLERISPLSHHSHSRTRTKLRDAIPAPDELSSAVSRVTAAPWEDPFALALGEAAPIAEHAEEENAGTPTKSTTSIPDADGSDDDGSFVDLDDESPDKMRLVAKALEAGDVVEEAHNIVRIVGVDALPGLLILGRRNLYLIDGLVQTPDCQIIEADQAPRDVLSIPSGTLADLDPTDQRSHRWPYSDVVETNKRAFLFRDVALELYFSDKQNFLVVFKDKRQRQAVVSRLSRVDKGDGMGRSILGSLVLDTVARAIDNRGYELDTLTRRWQSREISNFAYLQMLNQYANRTPNDVTQYPVFPWVLADYTSQILDLSKASTFRDLSLPMGALTPARRDAAVERYQATEGVGETPFHYGTHYSSSMIVCGYMIRESPFTDIFLALQGGTFDLADRLFSSIPKAWDSASSANRGDVRELIPEFFYSAAFLINMNHHDFGKKQVSGDTVDDVALPPWALGDPLLFVHWNREALESDFVSRHLPAWIDLTFGCKQRDPASFNCFHPLSYRGAVDLDKITDEAEKAASTAIIHNFGQTPVQIFKNPHPQRFLVGRTSLPVGTRYGISDHWQLLLRSILPIIESPRRIHHILDPQAPDAKPGVQPEHRLAVPGHPWLSLQYGFVDQSLRIYHTEHGPKLVHIVEGIEVTHATFASPTLLVTVSPLGVLTAWRLTVKGSGHRRGDTSLQREATLRGHEGSATCIAESTPWSVLVTGANDGTAMVWDTNRLRYTRTLKTPRREPIKFAAVSEANAHIALASDRYLYVFTLNGHPIASTSIDGGRFGLNTEGEDDASDDKFTGGITFLKKEFLKGGELFVVGVGSQLDLYRLAPGVRRFEDQEVEPWRLIKQGTLFRSDEHDAGDVTAVRFIGDTLYAAFEAPVGQKYPLYQWSLPDCNARNVPESASGVCMCKGCTRHFGLLEPRRHCGGCGGVFCGSHAVHVEGFSARYCDSCKTVLAYASALGLLQSRLGSRAGSRQVSRRPSVSGEAREPSSSAGLSMSPTTPTRAARE
ncbi:Beige protein-like 1 [Vanrija albida]|uniref:Beige protein-like 1 n=1 Tax=Vanrija albida TaxID=181172 RepID=A0ABR3PTR5_9TREE